MKHVAINALQYKQNSSGIGVMIRELFSRYARVTSRPCQVVLPHDGPDFPAGPHTELVRIPWDHRQSLHRMFFQTFSLGRRYGRDGMLLTTDSKTPFFLPKSCTLIPLITDLAVFRMPEVYQASRVWWWRLQYRYLCRRADLFLAISEFTKSEMVRVLNIPPEKIRVVPCAASEDLAPVTDPAVLADLRTRYTLPEHFLLFVGNNNPRKNLARMIQAFDRAKELAGIPHHLVIAGEQGWKFDPDAVLRDIRHRDTVHFIGFVPDEDMPALYSASELFLFPTLYEGFGIPVIESQLCGTPVLAGNSSSLPEVGGEAAVYVDPLNEEDICAGLLRILQDPDLARDLVRKGFQNAGRFSWEASARLLDQIIEEEVTT